MLDRLPTELVEAILEHLAPPLGGLAEHPVQPKDLRSVMCVSKRLCSLARPFFWRVVTVVSAYDAVRFLIFLCEPSKRDMIKQHVHTLQLSSLLRYSRPTFAHIQSLLALLPRTRRLELAGIAGSKVESSVFSNVGLEALQVYRIDFLDVLPPSGFDSLVELSLSNVTLTQQALSTSLTPGSFPSLRALSLISVFDINIYSNAPPVLANNMLAQLDLLQLFLRDELAFRPACRLQSTATPVVLLMRDGDETWCAADSAASHLAYFVSSPLSVRRNELSGIFTSSYQPSTLHLSAQLQPDRLVALDNKQENHAALLEDVKTTLKICEDRGVEVVWHEQDTTRLFAVSPSLWRWAKGVKAQRALEASGGGGASTSG